MRPVNLRAARRHQARLRPLPRRAVRGSGPLVMAATLVLLVMASPWLRPAVSSVGAGVQGALGLVVRDVHVSGTARLDDLAVQSALSVASGAPILTVDLEAARGRLEDLAWVETAVVRRSLPDVIEVGIVEHQALALWLGPDGAALLSANGDTVAVGAAELPRDLPLVTGVGAPQAAAAIEDILAAAARLGREVRRLDRVAEQRWRLVLAPDLRIELPPRDMERALDRLEAHAANHRLLDRGLATIDLRVADRLVVTPLPVVIRAEAG